MIHNHDATNTLKPDNLQIRGKNLNKYFAEILLSKIYERVKEMGDIKNFTYQILSNILVEMPDMRCL